MGNETILRIMRARCIVHRRVMCVKRRVFGLDLSQEGGGCDGFFRTQALGVITHDAGTLLDTALRVPRGGVFDKHSVTLTRPG